MLENAARPGHPDWWLLRLGNRLANRAPQVELLRQYLRGEPPAPVTHQDVSEAYQLFLKRARTNYCAPVVEAMLERAKLLGFRTGADGDELGDSEAWRILQANNFDAIVPQLLRTMLALGDAYVMIGAPDGDTGMPTMTAEEPAQVITEPAPNGRAAQAAVKMFRDDWTGEHRAVVLLAPSTPGGYVQVLHYRGHPHHGLRAETLLGHPQPVHTLNPAQWSLDADASGELPITRVPVVRLGNRTDLFGQSRSEYADVLDIQERINRNTFDRMVVAASQAFRQRWVSGDVPTENKDGTPVKLDELLQSAPDAVWALTGDVKFGEFSAADLTPILKANEADVMAMAKVTRTPAQHLLGGDLVNVGADAYQASLDPFLAKVGEWLTQCSDPLELAMSIAFEVLGDDVRSSLLDMEIDWANPQRFTLSERSDASVKARGTLSRRTILRKIWQMSPQEIARDEADRADDVLDSLLAPPAGGGEAAPTAPVETETG